MIAQEDSVLISPAERLTDHFQKASSFWNMVQAIVGLFNKPGKETVKRKKKQISQRERERRERQRHPRLLYTPDGPLVATKIKGGYKLSKPNV